MKITRTLLLPNTILILSFQAKSMMLNDYIEARDDGVNSVQLTFYLSGLIQGLEHSRKMVTSKEATTYCPPGGMNLISSNAAGLLNANIEEIKKGYQASILTLIKDIHS